ncbi:hypothetical protein CVM52_06650 [Pseudooceanicola lipolyticus]|uniref:histidine kinase n=1 Tax=Pseudooceanicola lipolyticus TaxID=2029104 RepID=A0A2M8J444_9RHOB|nr:hypothetical protein CVM52_06650 [Pseudooceanicola lipolyticus]
MIWSRLSLTGKLFSAVLFPVVLVVVLMVGALTYNMRNGFGQYLLETELHQLERLARGLAEHPEAAEGWPSLREFGAWIATVETYAARTPARPALPDMPPRGRPPGPPRPMRLPDRLALIAPDGKILAGRASGTAFADLPVDLPAGTAATLRLFGREEPSSGPGQLFLSRQLRSILLIAGISVAVASIVAFLTARQFLRPIHEVASHVTRLAKGDLRSRLKPRMNDELGRLMADQNALAESLQASRLRERQWVSDTSHELKTPLAVLQAEIEALQDGVRSATPATLDAMHGAVRRLSGLVDDLRLLASGDEGRLNLDLVRMDLSRVVEEACTSLQRSRLLQGLELQVATDPVVIVSADTRRMRQVLDNLLDNARRYTDAPGRIEVTCRRVGPRAEVIIQDTAPCPDAHGLATLFDRFSRSETSRSRDFGGSGLGLAICRSLLAAQGGTIEAAPSELGGLRLAFHLPLAEDEDD